jgi:hypothetical protein
LASVPCRPGVLLNRGSKRPEVEIPPPVPLAVRRAGQVALAVVLGFTSDARWRG